MIIGVLWWFSVGTSTRTVISGVEVSSVLDEVDGWSFGQEKFSIHNKWVRSKLVYISVS